MCCWPVTTVELEEAPKKKPEEKQNYIVVSDKLNLQPMRTKSSASLDKSQPTGSRASIDMGHQFVYNAAPAPAQQRVAPNPWNIPPPAQEQASANFGDNSQPAQEQVAANPWDAPAPAQPQVPTTSAAPTAPNRMGHQYIYNPAPAPTRQQAAPNPWDDPAPAHQQVAGNPWNNPPPAQAPFNPWTHMQHPGVSHVACPAFYTFYPLLVAPPPAAMHYPGHTGVQFYTSAPAAEPSNLTVYQGKPADGGGPNAVYAYHSAGGINPNPIQMVPQTPSPDDEFYCRELDSSYTLKKGTTIMRDCQPGYWKHGSTGYPYWVRTT